MKKVEVDAAAIRTILTFLGTRTTLHPEVVKGALVEFAQALNTIPAVDLPLMEGWKAKPKTGRNYLRAGHKAYDEVMIVSMKPFIVVSLDGAHVWEGLDEALFEPYHRMEGVQHDLIRLAFDDYMKKKGL